MPLLFSFFCRLLTGVRAASDASFLSDQAPLLGQTLSVRDCCVSRRCWPGCLGRAPSSCPLVLVVVVVLRRQAVQDDQEGQVAEQDAERCQAVEVPMSDRAAAVSLAHLVDEACLCASCRRGRGQRAPS